MQKHKVFGVGITDTTIPAAVELYRRKILTFSGRITTIYFVNTHTLTLAMRSPAYTETLNTADYVFGDGTGVRWAMRAVNGVALQDNVNGTDLTPHFLRSTSESGYRCYLLGARPVEVEKAARYFEDNFKGWSVAGYHHGFFAASEEDGIVAEINGSGAQLLLVGMGNPLQEEFIARNRERLSIPLAAGTGGLFAYWAGDLDRAPLWMRRLGIEWVHILIRQPHKWKRYLIGNLRFIYGIGKEVLKRKLGRMVPNAS